MSRRFGPIRQVGYVVKDLRRAIDHWVQVADVGPWFLAENLTYEGFAYRGVPGQLKLSVALANSGELQLELIQPLDQAPSMFREFLDAGQEGMHHWCALPEDYDACLADAEAAGLRVGQSGSSPRGRWVYFADADHPGSIIEVAEITPVRKGINDAVRRAAATWDGRMPVRPFPIV